MMESTLEEGKCGEGLGDPSLCGISSYDASGDDCAKFPRYIEGLSITNM